MDIENESLIKLRAIDEELTFLQEELDRLDSKLSKVNSITIPNIHDITVLVKKTFDAYKEILSQYALTK